MFDSTLGAWKLAYVLQAGLNLGVPYTVAGYPTGQNPKTSLPWAPAADGLRNIVGRVNRDGTATIWAITSTVSGGGDQGADPNQLVMITDNLAATSAPAGESFAAIRTARFGEVFAAFRSRRGPIATGSSTPTTTATTIITRPFCP